MAEALEACCGGADSKALSDLGATHTREREQWEEQRNKQRQAW